MEFTISNIKVILKHEIPLIPIVKQLEDLNKIIMVLYII